MNAKTFFAGTSIALALAVAAATPANAVITTFATFAPSTNSTYNFYYNNPTTNGHSTTASFYTIATPTSKVAGGVDVTFSFINEGSLGAAVTNVTALFTLNGTTTSPAVLDPFSHNLEQTTAGTFSFKSTAPITVGSVVYAAGDTLLSGTFSNAILAGKSNTGGITGDNNVTYADTLTLGSDFVTFVPGANLGMSISLSSIIPALSDAMAGTYALKTFKTDASGQFSADPVPRSNATPEPASWALMMVGFGLAGASLRRRARVQVAA